MGPGCNWCAYLSPEVLCQALFIAMAFSCAHRNHFFCLYSTQVFLRHYTPNRGRWNESYFLDYTPINASPKKWSNTLNASTICWRIVWVYLTILLDWRWKGDGSLHKIKSSDIMAGAIWLLILYVKVATVSIFLGGIITESYLLERTSVITVYQFGSSFICLLIL